MTGFDPGDRVRIGEPHTYAEHLGTVIGTAPVPQPEGYEDDAYVIRTDDGERVHVYPEHLTPAGGMSYVAYLANDGTEADRHLMSSRDAETLACEQPDRTLIVATWPAVTP